MFVARGRCEAVISEEERPGQSVEQLQTGLTAQHNLTSQLAVTVISKVKSAPALISAFHLILVGVNQRKNNLIRKKTKVAWIQ